MSAPQQVIGHYRVIAKLGAGGMGEVWRATDPRLQRDVAIKVLPPAFASDPMRMARFAREAQLLASLNHPAIASIYGVEQNALVMELVEGPTLAERIAQGPIALDEALPIATQIAEALEFAHERGIVHRDLKPANIKLTADGRVKILDFGLAKAVSADSESRPSADAPTLTSPATMIGTILGTAAYMSPEQARGKPVDRRADIWAFGVVLYEMLSGQRPFDGEDVTETLAAVVKTAPRLDALPEPARAVIQRSLQKDPRQRWQAIGDARFELEHSAPNPAAPSAGRAGWRRSMAWGATLLLLGAALGGAAVWLRTPAPTNSVMRSEYVLPPAQAFTRPGSHVLAISPDGTHLVYVANNRLYLRALDSLQAQPIPGSEEDPADPAFSPDGKWIAYDVPGPAALHKIAVGGGPPVVLCPIVGHVFGISWQNDMIAFGQEVHGASSVQAVADTGGTPRTLTQFDASHGRLRQVQFLPDHRGVILGLYFTTGQRQIAVQALDGSPPRVLVNGGFDPHLLEGGYLAFMKAGTLMAQRFDPHRLTLAGEPVPLVEGVSFSSNSSTDIGQFAVSANGTLTYRPGLALGGSRTLTWVDRDGQEQDLGAPPQAYHMLRLSPDDGRIAVGIISPQNSDLRNIWIWDIQRRALGRLTFGDGHTTDSAWMPGGQEIVYAAATGTTPGLFRAASDGTGNPILITTPGGSPEFITPDGKQIGFYRPDAGQVIVVPPANPRPLPLSPGTSVAGGAALSPDGRWLAYASDESGTANVYVRPYPAIDSGHWQVSNAGGVEPLWARSGRELFYVNADQLWAVPVELGSAPKFGPAHALFSTKAYYAITSLQWRFYDVAADGRFLFIKQPPAPAQAPNPSLVIVTHWLDEVKARVK